MLVAQQVIDILRNEYDYKDEFTYPVVIRFDDNNFFIKSDTEDGYHEIKELQCDCETFAIQGSCGHIAYIQRRYHKL